jgi:hypothetical protein
MRANLANFLADVGSDPNLLARLAADPAGQLQEADLTDHERAAVLTRDSRKIAAALAESGFALGDVSDDVLPSKKRAPAKRAPKKTPKTPKKKAPKKSVRKRPSKAGKTGRTRR